MTGRRPARLLAPVALVAAALALFAVVTSSNGGDTAESNATPTPTATATATPERKRGGGGATSGETYTVEPGDTPLAIAEETGVDYDALLEANPDLDANALTVGEELVLP